MKIDMHCCLTERGELVKEAPLTEKEALNALCLLLKTRMVDEKMILLQRQGRVSFALSSLGEEAIAVGSALALEGGDWIFPQYRECGALFARGYPLERFLDQMFGTEEDSAKGRQMPNHFGSKALNVVTVSSPIATQIPHAVGASFAMKRKKEPQVALVFFGEGATSEGDFHAGMNFAAVLKTPTLFLCRNNGYAISTPASSQFSTHTIAEKASSYGMRGVRVDGNDLFAVYQVVKEAREVALKEGPILIEAVTYRMGAHSTSDDPTRYRDQKELEIWRERDPLLRLKRYLKISDAEMETMRQKIKEEIEETVRRVETKKKPDAKVLTEDVFEKMTPELKEEQQWLS